MPDSASENGSRPALKCYVLCSSPRTGSWLLAEGLADTGIAGNPDEYFSAGRELARHNSNANGQASSYAEYVTHVFNLASTPNGVAGFKAHLDQLDYLIFRWQLLSRSRCSTFREVIRDVFPEAIWIYSRRRDKVRQAVSWSRSLQTRQWFDIPGDTSQRTVIPEYDFNQIATLHHRIISEETTWMEFFAAIREMPLVIDYEDLAASYEPTIAAVLRYIGLAQQAPASVPPPRLRRQSDSISEDWIDRYRREISSRG
jgi:LPS sulfotransferase NodH